MMRYLVFAAPVLAAASSVSPLSPEVARPAAEVAATQHSGLSDQAGRGLAFAQQRCSSCHAVLANVASPNPEAPSFQDVANRPEVTASTLGQFLRSSHNYPAAMNFVIEGEEISDLADYIMTLRKADYRPVM